MSSTAMVMATATAMRMWSKLLAVMILGRSDFGIENFNLVTACTVLRGAGRR